MGFIFSMRDIRTKKKFAYKMMNPIHRHDKWVLNCLKNEFDIAKKFKSPNLATSYEWVKEGPGFIMDYIEGEELKYYLENHIVPMKYRITILLGVCDALTYMHEKLSKTTLHLDIKPENVIVRDLADRETLRRHHIALIDYGTAEEKIKGPKILSLKGIKDLLSDQKIVGGSYLYMSPEQSRVEDLDIRSDIYSLGCMMFELFTGRPPFVPQFMSSASRDDVGLEETPLDRQELKIMHCSDLPPRPQDINPRVTKPLGEVILKCLEKKPANRFSSVTEVSLELMRLNI